MRQRPIFRAFATVLILLLGGGPAYSIQRDGPPVKLQPPVPPSDVPRVGTPFQMSFCDPPPSNPNDLCGNLTGGTANPTGGTPPYYFKLDTMGGFLPFGLTLHPNGLVTGTPTAVGSRDVRVCAVDQVGNSQCVNYTFNVRESSQANETRVAAKGKREEPDQESPEVARKGGVPMGAMLGLAGAAVGLGVGLAAIAQLNTEASCGPAPTIPNSCLGIGRNSSSCNQALADYSSWCSCMGGSFSTSTGSCNR